MRNHADVDWQDIRCHVEFRDAQGHVIHAEQVKDPIRIPSLPANDKLSFVLRLDAQADLERYKSVSVRVVRAQRARPGLFLDL